MIAHRATEGIEADGYVHLHIIPPDNGDLLGKFYPCSRKAMEDTWRDRIRNHDAYRILSPCDFLSPIDPDRYKGLLDYLRLRYW